MTNVSKLPEKRCRKSSSAAVTEPLVDHIVVANGKNCSREMELRRTCVCEILIGLLKDHGKSGAVLNEFNLSYETMQANAQALEPNRQKKPNCKATPSAHVDIVIKKARMTAGKLQQKFESIHILLSLITTKEGSKKTQALLKKSGVDPEIVIAKACEALHITKDDWIAALPN